MDLPRLHEARAALHGAGAAEAPETAEWRGGAGGWRPRPPEADCPRQEEERPLYRVQEGRPGAPGDRAGGGAGGGRGQ